jgi:hypothetical protein
MRQISIFLHGFPKGSSRWALEMAARARSEPQWRSKWLLESASVPQGRSKWLLEQGRSRSGARNGRSARFGSEGALELAVRARSEPQWRSK